MGEIGTERLLLRIFEQVGIILHINDLTFFKLKQMPHPDSEEFVEINREAVIQPKRVLRTNHFDTTKWDWIDLHKGDIVIATAYKSGTTWVQNVVKELLYIDQVAPSEFIACSTWFDFRLPSHETHKPILRSFKGRKLLKTHSPLDAIPFSREIKYIYVGRDGRDCFMSLMNNFRNASDAFYNAINQDLGDIDSPFPRFIEEDHHEAKIFNKWISEGWPAMTGETDGWPYWSVFDNVASWWHAKNESNVMFIHFNDLKRDLASCIRKIAEFIEVDVPESVYPILAQKLSFEGLKASALANESGVISPPGIFWNNGLEDFFFKGTNGRWRNVLSAEQVAKYEEVAASKLPHDCNMWLHGIE